jgi:hypothetical protein
MAAEKYPPSYIVSGGPIIPISHSNILSFFNSSENPGTIEVESSSLIFDTFELFC